MYRTYNKLLIWIFLIFLLVGFVNAAGTCTHDKFEYHPGEAAVFSCDCTLPGEENQAGFIVWKNSTDDILQVIAANSGSCRSSLFGDSYLFLIGQDFLGNATFSLNNDGTGIPINWDDGDDVISDNFNVSGASSIDCIIDFVNDNASFIFEGNLGELAAFQLVVSDGVTSNTLTHANCHIHVLDASGAAPLFHEPYTPPLDVSIESGAEGEVMFQFSLDQAFWEARTTYLIQANCYCTINGTTEQCYIGGDSFGIIAGFKECTAELLFTTGVDNRDVNVDNIFEILISLGLMIFIFVLLGLKIQGTAMKEFFFGLAIIETIIGLAITYLKQQSLTLVPLLRINFISIFLIFGGMAIYVFLLLMIKLINPDTEGKLEEIKWRKR